MNDHLQNQFYFCVEYEILSPKCSLGSFNGIIENIFGITFLFLNCREAFPLKEEIGVLLRGQVIKGVISKSSSYCTNYTPREGGGAGGKGTEEK